MATYDMAEVRIEMRLLKHAIKHADPNEPGIGHWHERLRVLDLVDLYACKERDHERGDCWSQAHLSTDAVRASSNFGRCRDNCRCYRHAVIAFVDDTVAAFPDGPFMEGLVSWPRVTGE